MKYSLLWLYAAKHIITEFHKYTKTLYDNNTYGTNVEIPIEFLALLARKFASLFRYCSLAE